MSDYVNPDVLTKIMNLLPIKDLLRCRSVCKWWKEMVESKSYMAPSKKPRFIAQNIPFHYLLIDPHALPSFATLRSPIEIGSDDEDLVFDEIVCCVMGVICFKFNSILYLWNPLIHRLSSIPQPYPPNSLCYKPCGFWIEPSTYDSKIVVYCPKQKRVSLFSSRNQAWTEVASDVEIGWGESTFRQVVISGVGHWLAYVQVHFCRVIAYFDFVQEKFGMIELPKKLANEDNVMNVWKWQGSLSVLHWWGYECNVWAMRSGSWSKVFTLDLVSHSLRDVLWMDESGPRVLAQSTDGHLAMYDSRGNRVGLSSGFIARGAPFVVAYEFVESLVFPAIPSVEG